MMAVEQRRNVHGARWATAGRFALTIPSFSRARLLVTELEVHPPVQGSFVVLDYAPRPPRRRFIAAVASLAWHVLAATARWCLRNRSHVMGITAAVIAAFIVTVALDARVVLNTPVYGGCGANRGRAYDYLYLSGLALWSLPLLSLASRRSSWAGRVARSAALIAALWWLYMRYPMYGQRLFL